MSTSSQLFTFNLLLLTATFSPAQHPTIHFWNVGHNDDGIMYRRLAKKFEAQTGIRVIVTQLGWGNFQQKYLTALAAQLPPDIGTANTGGPYEYGRVGGVVDLASAFPEDYAALKEQLFDNLWGSMEYEGKVFGVPCGLTTLMLFYRKDIFEQLQLAPPRTWSELENVITVLNRHDYQYGFEWTRENGWATDLWTYPFGYLRYSDDQTHAPWDQPGFIRGIQTAVRFWNLFNLPVSKNNKPVELFALAASAKGLLMPMFIDYAVRYSEITVKAPHLAGKWGMVPMPAADNGKLRLMFGGIALVIFRLSPHQQAAMQWLRYLMSPEIQYEIMQDFMRNRGERNEFYISPNRVMYEEFPMPYDDATTAAVVTAVSKIGTAAPTPGAVQADRLLENTLREIRAELTPVMQRMAARHNLNVWNFRKAFAAGEFIEDKHRLRALADSLTAAKLIAVKPLADAELRRGHEEYETHYRHLLDTVAEKERAWDVLDWSKLAITLLIAFTTIAILALPALRDNWRSYLFIAPPIILLLVFLIIPVIVSLYLSLTKYNPILPLAMANWVGVENYFELLSGAELWQSLWRSLYFAMLTIPIQLFIGILLAVGLDKSLRPDRLFKFAYFSPLVTSVVSVSLIWTALYLGTRYGWLNALLLELGVTQDPIAFLDGQSTFLNCVIVMTVWHGLAFVILINLAGLQNIPSALYEAARLDGANAAQQFFRITLPSLRPQIVFLTITGAIGAIQVFEQIFMLGGGSAETGSKFGPNDSGMTMVPFIFRKGFEDFRMGEASAIAYILFLVILVLSALNWKILVGED